MVSSAETDIFDSLNYVSRGGQKLAKALDFFGVSPQGKVCIDCGASTGGFTDCLLQRGASLVYAVDVGYGQLAWTLRNDPRVKVMERTNIRCVTSDMLEATPTLAVIDVSFISLSLVLPIVRTLGSCEVICLIKPQFEAGKGKVGKKGVVRDAEVHKEVLNTFVCQAKDSGFTARGLTYSPVKGPKGNIEYLGYLNIQSAITDGDTLSASDITTVVAQSHKELDI